MNKQKMIEDLLDSFGYIINGADDTNTRIISWAKNVGSALKAAGMTDEFSIWDDAASEALEHLNYSLGGFSDEEAGHAIALKAVLVGFYNKISPIEADKKLFDSDVLTGTRTYIEKLASQANGCYQYGWHDACAVIVRRIVEVMIIDCFEKHNLSQELNDDNGRRLGLEKLINKFLSESNKQTWHLTHMAKKHIPKLKDLKDLGDAAAHGRSITPKARIDRLAQSISYAVAGIAEIAYR